MASRTKTWPNSGPTAQFTRIDAGHPLFSVGLTRVASVPECASVRGIPVGIRRRVAQLWGFCGGSQKPRQVRPVRHGGTKYRDFRELMTTFRVT